MDEAGDPLWHTAQLRFQLRNCLASPKRFGVIGPEDSLLVGKELAQHTEGLALIAGDRSDIAPSPKGSGVIGSQDSLLVGEELAQQAQGLALIAGLPSD